MVGNFGFIHEKIEIKILILFILRRLQSAITFDMLTELAMCDDGISYFDFTECVSELIETEHVQVRDNKYFLTAKGVRNGELTENSLPYSVRQKVEETTAAARSVTGRNSMIKTMHTANQDGGYTVTLTLSDGVGDIATMSLYAINEKQAHILEKGFRKNAENIYNTIIGMMLK